MKSEKKFSTINTIHEIKNQPDLWLKIWDSINNDRKKIERFLSPLLKKEGLQIVLTGAGSSAFIGKSIQHAFRYYEHITPLAVSTTSLVTHFGNYFSRKSPVLFISFARSGDSPESLAVVELAEKFCSEANHLAITCNPDGNLARKIVSLKNGRGLTIVLPPETEDKGLAMTGSFTSMMLAALLISALDKIDTAKKPLKAVSETDNNLISDYSKALELIASMDFDRIVFLGSGPLVNIARESHLKVQELTDGFVIGKHDSFLGFRHGPKAVVNEKTLIVYLFSHDDYVFQYERDLAVQIAKDNFHLKTIGVFPTQEQSTLLSCDLDIIMNPSVTDVPGDLSLLLYVLPAQLLGFYKSLDLGLQPDTPSANNSISRVVKGVRIYSEGI